MKKCDFCEKYDAVNNICCGSVGYSYCRDAAERFLEYMKSTNTHTNNKNININNKRR